MNVKFAASDSLPVADCVPQSLYTMAQALNLDQSSTRDIGLLHQFLDDKSNRILKVCGKYRLSTSIPTENRARIKYLPNGPYEAFSILGWNPLTMDVCILPNMCIIRYQAHLSGIPWHFVFVVPHVEYHYLLSNTQALQDSTRIPIKHFINGPDCKRFSWDTECNKVGKMWSAYHVSNSTGRW